MKHPLKFFSGIDIELSDADLSQIAMPDLFFVCVCVSNNQPAWISKEPLKIVKWLKSVVVYAIKWTSFLVLRA